MTQRGSLINTKEIGLPDELLRMSELLAANVHHRWVQRRFADGWQYGAKRDDNRKEDPSLVPYSELSQTEKEYWRETALDTIKTILACGFELNSSCPGQSSRSPEEYSSVLAHAVDTFGSRINANAWLNKPNRLFHNQTPLQILTEDPAAVEEELVRIDHGMFV